jgi:hypothetical protein
MNLLIQPLFAPMMDAQREQMQAAIEAERKAELQKLKDEEELAKTAEEKAAIQAREKTLAAKPVPKMPDMSRMWGMTDPRLQGFFWIDFLTMIPLNLAMLISGVGLVTLKEWGRVIGVYVAGLKIARLIALYSVFIVAVAPVWTQQLTKTLEEMMPPGGPNAQQMNTLATVYGVMITVYAVSMIILGAIYPAIAFWVLTRPSAKAACAQRFGTSTY